jgi:thioredoxin-like negative regulator of GroEL
MIPGTPEGDLADWVGDIREGIAEVTRLAATDVAAAQKKALDLYVTRQEYSEMYYGVDGRNKATAELADAIESAEEHFHVVMKLLANPNPALAELKSAIAALDTQQALVAKLNTDLAQATSQRFNVRGIPTTIVFRDGKEANRITGAVKFAELEKLLASGD